MATISCIIPVYNEGPRIANVISIVSACKKITEVIVVDDGSSDATREEIKKFRSVRALAHEHNQGKTAALMTGFTAATGEYILFVDADLVGLTACDLDALIDPVLLGQAAVSMSMRKNSPWIDRKIGIDIFSGDRVFKKSLLAPYTQEIARLARFGFESFFNKIIIKNNLPISVVFWRSVVSPWKYQKTGLAKGIMGDVRMIRDILKTISVFQVVYQFIKLTLLKVS